MRSLLCLAAGAAAVGLVVTATPAVAAPTPDPAGAVHFLVTSDNGTSGGPMLSADGYYDVQLVPGLADFGLTMDGAFALAATGTDNATLAKVTSFITGGTDPSGNTINTWSGIGTAGPIAGGIGKEALLAEVTGFDPHTFGGQNLITALDQAVCPGPVTNVNITCVAAGDYDNATSTFDQALPIIAQLRAGDTAGAAAPITYLESLQEPDGAWPSVLPSDGSSDVDSTAMAAMALALVPGDTAATAVRKAIAWIATQPGADGGFHGASGDSTNSTALAIQGLTLAKATYGTQIDAALAFLAGQQNSDGGFTIAVGQPGSDVRATAQVVGGIIGTSFATLSDNISGTPPPSSTSATPTTTTTTTAPTTEPTTDVVTPASGATKTLPNTGVNVLPMVALGALLLVGGFGLLLSRRRRGLR